MTRRRFLVRRGHAEGQPDGPLGIREPVGLCDGPYGCLGYVNEIEVHIRVGKGFQECAENFG